MKELSIEEKAKAYDKAFERAKAMIKVAANQDEAIGFANTIFPELEESEDDRIRKGIIRNLEYLADRAEGFVKDELKERIAWLEKQGEKKSADKVEPKFKVGDWITDGYLHNKITDVLEDRYIVDTKFAKRSSIPFKFENYYHLWTIQDAKDGDVLAFDDNTIVIFKDLYNATTFHSYCHIEDGVFSISQDDMPDWWKGKGFHLASKEQRDLLFQKMKEASYEWDADKKELKKIEDEPENYKQQLMSEMTNLVKDYIRQKASWSKEDENILNAITYVVKNSGYKRCIGVPIEIMIDWLTFLKDRVQPKQEWSEEDEAKLKSACALIRNTSLNGNEGVEDFTIDWLKSLKGRVQPKHEWSKEDIYTIENIDSVLFYDKDLPEDTCVRLRNWLKSLKDRYSWKPSDEQLEALKNAIHLKPFENPSDSLLWGLYEQLKKLK